MTAPQETLDFGEPIYVYDDSQAVDDGVLIPLDENDRATASVFADMARGLAEDDPPKGCPIDLLGWCRATTGEDRALAAARAIVGCNRGAAMRADAGGNFLVMHFRVEDGGRIVALIDGAPPEDDPPNGRKILRLVPNELGGVTLMYPSDY